MTFYLGVPEPAWVQRTDVPLFVSARRLRRVKGIRRRIGRVALDSGGFTELEKFGKWMTSHEQYRDEVQEWDERIGGFDWVAPQDWMSEPFMLAKTGLSVEEHQRRTVASVVRLREDLAVPVIPVLQGWHRADYARCVHLYRENGIDLSAEAVVGLGSVCRRQATSEAALIVSTLVYDHGISKLHGFGMKKGGLALIGDLLGSADSMAWSMNARKHPALPGCKHRSCNYCLKWALKWRRELLEDLGDQPRFAFAA